jgi:hypothetical protein
MEWDDWKLIDMKSLVNAGLSAVACSLVIRPEMVISITGLNFHYSSGQAAPI